MTRELFDKALDHFAARLTIARSLGGIGNWKAVDDSRDALFEAVSVPPEAAREPKVCPNGLTPDGPVCPRCGGKRGPSGVDGGSWVHYPAASQGEAERQPVAWAVCDKGGCIQPFVTKEAARGWAGKNRRVIPLYARSAGEGTPSVEKNLRRVIQRIATRDWIIDTAYDEATKNFGWQVNVRDGAATQRGQKYKAVRETFATEPTEAGLNGLALLEGAQHTQEKAK